jgi:8-oxo-dGTP diphosphatase
VSDEDKIIEELKDRLDEKEDNTTSWGKLDLQAQPILAVDAIIRYRDEGFVLIKRRFSPFQGFWALPGGIVNYGEAVPDALKREIKEETNLNIEIIRLIDIYSNPNRDPRGHVISICYLCKAIGGKLKATSDAEAIKIFSISEIKDLKLAFDHMKMFENSGVLD